VALALNLSGNTMSYEDRDPYGMYRAHPTGATGMARLHGPGPELMGANTLTGNDVVNTQGEGLGDIKEFMLDMRSGRVAYAVLSFGGLMGMGDKLFAVPFNALKLDTANKCFVLNQDKARLESAPGFNKEAWPNMADSSWANDVHAYYGTEPNPVVHPL